MYGEEKILHLLEGFWHELNKHDDVNNMHGWFQKLFKSRDSASAQREQKAKVTKNTVSSINSVSPSPVSSPSGTTPTNSLQSQSALHSQLRLSREYDVFVCHSSVDSDSEEAGRLVYFLETSPRSLRCFLRHRDDCPGGAVSTELCQAVQNSHVWALLITPNFLQDDWCKYVMHQVLTEAPMSSRIIPLVQNLSHSEYPQELKFYFYIDLSRNPKWGYSQLNKTVLKYLEDLVKNEKTLDCNMDSSGNGLSGEDSSKTDNMMSKHDPTGTSNPLEVLEKKDGSFSDDCCDLHQE